jgi:hypothetical protein
MACGSGGQEGHTDARVGSLAHSLCGCLQLSWIDALRCMLGHTHKPLCCCWWCFCWPSVPSPSLTTRPCAPDLPPCHPLLLLLSVRTKKHPAPLLVKYVLQLLQQARLRQEQLTADAAGSTPQQGKVHESHIISTCTMSGVRQGVFFGTPPCTPRMALHFLAVHGYCRQ